MTTLLTTRGGLQVETRQSVFKCLVQLYLVRRGGLYSWQGTAHE